jgi:hypothetical protein
MVVYFRDAGALSVIFISGDPFISGFPGPIKRFSGYLLRDCQVMMMMMYLSSVYFGTLEMDLWLHVPSDGCDQFRNQASVQRMIR